MDLDTGRYGPTGRRLPPSEGIAAGGGLSGVLAGGAMMLTLMTVSASLGQGFWTPLELVGGTLLGLNAVLGGFWAGAVGLALHLSASAAWGMLFASLLSRETTAGQAFWSGLVYGVAVWAVMTYIGLPVLDRTMEPRVNLIQGAWFACHLLYGACLAWTPALRRRWLEALGEYPAYVYRPVRGDGLVVERGTPVGVAER